MRSAKLITQIIVLSLASACPAYAKLSDQDQQLLDLTKYLSANPRLLDPRYLSYQFGTPEAQWGGDFEWNQRNSRTLLYKLENRPSVRNGAVNIKLTIFSPNESHITFSELESALVAPAKKYFDQRLYRAETFPVSASTNVLATQPANVFSVREIAIEYDGVKVAPREDDYQAAAENRRALAFDHHKNGRHSQAHPMLASHVQEQPTDVEARIKLAESYRAQFCLNPAIEQYRLALAQCPSDSPLRQQCIDGLKELRVIPLAPGEKRPAKSPPSPSADNSLGARFLGFFNKQPTPSSNTLIQVNPKNTKGSVTMTNSSPVSGSASNPEQFNAGF